MLKAERKKPKITLQYTLQPVQKVFEKTFAYSFWEWIGEENVNMLRLWILQICKRKMSEDTQVETQSNNIKLEPILYEYSKFQYQAHFHG